MKRSDRPRSLWVDETEVKCQGIEDSRLTICCEFGLFKSPQQGCKSKNFKLTVLSCDIGDIVDAGDCQHVEDDVGAADVQHRQEIKNKTCSFLSW